MTTDAEVYQTLGALREAVEHMKATVQHMVTMWSQQELAASEGRRVLHQKVDDLKHVVSGLDSKVTALDKAMTEVKPAVKEFENQREQQKGAMKLGKMLWGAMVMAAGGLGWALSQWFSMPKPPH